MKVQKAVVGQKFIASIFIICYIVWRVQKILKNSRSFNFKVVSTSVRETNAKRTMWTCRRTAFAFIRLCGVCSVNRRTLFVWSRYFKEKYVRNHTDVDVLSFQQPTNNQKNACSFACVTNAEQATFWHSLAFASVLHALFAFAYRCGHALKVNFF